MGGCLHGSCKEEPRVSVECSKTGACRGVHAKDGMVNISINLCYDTSCARQMTFNLGGSKIDGDVLQGACRRRHGRCPKTGAAYMTPAPSVRRLVSREIIPTMYCGQHAEDGMVNAYGRHCSHISCTGRPAFDFEGSKVGVYCKQHAEDGTANALARRCYHASCTRQPRFNAEGHKMAMHSKQYAEDGMVDVFSRRCSHYMCTMSPSFNIEGSKAPAYRKKHAEPGMVNVSTKRCSHNSCTTKPIFNVEGNTVAYCRQHAVNGMIKAHQTRHCLHSSCPKRLAWGVLTDGAATT